MFSIKEYLTNRGINFRESGKNVKRGFINIKCFNHPDKSFHLGINPQTLMMYCWHCGPLGHVRRLIQQIEDCSYYSVNEILKSFQVDLIFPTEEKEHGHPNFLKLPKEFSKKFEEYHIDYLNKRGFNHYELMKNYDLYATDHFGEYKFRIIIPIIMDGRIVSYTGRDVTDQQYLRYKNCYEHLAVLPRKELIFNYDNIFSDTVIIVEGPFDCMRIGKGTIALLSLAFTREQVLKLKNKKIKRAFIMFDKKTEDRARQLESFLTFVPEIYHVDLIGSAEDPGELPEEDVKYLRRQVFS